MSTELSADIPDAERFGIPNGFVVKLTGPWRKDADPWSAALAPEWAPNKAVASGHGTTPGEAIARAVVQFSEARAA